MYLSGQPAWEEPEKQAESYQYSPFMRRYCLYPDGVREFANNGTYLTYQRYVEYESTFLSSSLINLFMSASDQKYRLLSVELVRYASFDLLKCENHA